MLLLAWLGETTRPTRDAYLLGFGDLSDEALIELFREICDIEVVPDAMTYLAESVVIAAAKPFEGRRLADALSATFERRRTPILDAIPLALAEEFAAAP